MTVSVVLWVLRAPFFVVVLVPRVLGTAVSYWAGLPFSLRILFFTF
jgi:hypothetical protein